MRGRLIRPCLAELFRLDTAATAADPDGAGELMSGYDDVFREPVKLPGGISARVEMEPVLVPCQPEIGNFQTMQMGASGNTPKSAITLVFHFQNLEDLGLVDATTGTALIGVSTRLGSLRYIYDGSLIQAFLPETGGLFCTEAQIQSFGLLSHKRNLLLCSFGEREQGYRR